MQRVDHDGDQAEDIQAAKRVVSDIFAKKCSEHSLLADLSQTLVV